MSKCPKSGQLWVSIEAPGVIFFDICHFKKIIWAYFNLKKLYDMVQSSGTLTPKFDKLTSTYCQILSNAWQASEHKTLFYVENLIAVILSLFAINNSQKLSFLVIFSDFGAWKKNVLYEDVLFDTNFRGRNEVQINKWTPPNPNRFAPGELLFWTKCGS